MPHIRILPVGLRNKIAAGEVVERPASVVKELIENSIDAGSSDIRVDILHGGKRLIRVADNGCGMDKEDALLCLQRHATSKLSSEEDLFMVTTMGFRGEALPSIASVSKVLLTTGARDSSTGVSVEVSGGQVIQVRDAACTGTSLEVRDLFFNTPARRKFMKTDSTELSHIIDAVTREALSHPGIGFTLSADRKESVVLPRAAGLKERIMQVFGEEFVSGLAAVTAEGPTGMTAFVSRPDNFRNSRSHQYIFINSRPVKDQSLSHAVYRAFEGIMPAEKHPVFFLFISMDPSGVDFNVHPAKREVRFADKERLYRFVMGAIREAVRSERQETARSFYAPADISETGSYPQTQADAGPVRTAEPAEIPFRHTPPHIYLGDTFIALAGKGGLTLIDHHAAHERILYERFLGKADINSRQLLFPRQVVLSKKEHEALLSSRGTLSEFGIEVDDFGKNTLIVRSLPEALSEADLRGVLADAASAILEGEHPGRPLSEAVAARLACHSSVRGRAVLGREEVSRLLDDLDSTDRPDQCPHGRPTRIFLSLDDLKKMFRRK